MFAVLQMHSICMERSLTEPEILSAQNSAAVVTSVAEEFHLSHNR